MSSQTFDRSAEPKDASMYSRWGRGLMLAGLLMFLVGLPTAAIGGYSLRESVPSVTENTVAKATLGEPLTIPQTDDEVRVFVDFGGKLPRPSGSAINNQQRKSDLLARDERASLQSSIVCAPDALDSGSADLTINQFVLQGTADASGGAVTVDCRASGDAEGLTYLATTGGAGVGRSGLAAVLGILAVGGGIILLAIGSIIRTRGKR